MNGIKKNKGGSFLSILQDYLKWFLHYLIFVAAIFLILTSAFVVALYFPSYGKLGAFLLIALGAYATYKMRLFQRLQQFAH